MGALLVWPQGAVVPAVPIRDPGGLWERRRRAKPPQRTAVDAVQTNAAISPTVSPRRSNSPFGRRLQPLDVLTPASVRRKQAVRAIRQKHTHEQYSNRLLHPLPFLRHTVADTAIQSIELIPTARWILASTRQRRTCVSLLRLFPGSPNVSGPDSQWPLLAGAESAANTAIRARYQARLHLMGKLLRDLYCLSCYTSPCPAFWRRG